MPRIIASGVGVLFLALGLGAPPAAAIGVPTCLNSTVPACIVLVGSDGATASPAGTFSLTIRDLANNPVPFSLVTVDLSNATDLALCADQLDPEITVNCTGKIASKRTDANGVVTFTLLGSSFGDPNTLLGAGRIYWQGTYCGSRTVSAFDFDGESGVGANDFSQWFSDFGSGHPYGRSDYDCSGNLGANDLALWFAAFGSGAQTVSCGSSCP